MALETATTFTTHADPMDRDVTTPAGLGPLGWGRWFWRRLTSMRTALVLLLLLGLAAIPGSLVPQRTSDAMAVNRFVADNPELSAWDERLGLFDVYGSPWFSAIYLLLFLSLVGCLVPRAGQHWRMWRASPTAPPRSLSRLDAVTTFPGDAAALDSAAERLRAERWRVRRGPDWVAGEKGFIRETGNQIFHFALLGVLAAVGWGALTGWHGTVVLREGTGFADAVTQYDTFTAGRFSGGDSLPPFTVRLQSFDVDFERGEAQRGAPRDFDARALVTDADGNQQTEQFSVNAPLTVDGVKVYLLGHGYAPRVTVRDGDGNIVFDDSVVFLPQDGNFTSEGVIKAPDAQPDQLGFRGIFLPTAAIDPHTGPTSTFPAPDDPALFLSAYRGDLGLDDGTPQNVYQLDDSGLKQLGLEAMRVGDSWKLPEGAGTVTFTGIDRYVSLKVAHDPGGAWALVFVGIAILGVCLSLFVRRRRVWVTAGDGTVTVAGVARGEGDMTDDVTSLADAVRTQTARTGGTADV
ncbi:MAG: cytochrome c biogenesis protein ResB [Candidatus Nanopelagicales bacterium]